MIASSFFSRVASSSRTLAILLLFVLTPIVGCKERPPKVPGETDIAIEEVTIEPGDPSKPLHVSTKPLFERLGMRPESLLYTGRTYSEFREAEDRRRIEAFFQNLGYLDVEVSKANVTFLEDGTKASIGFTVIENDLYDVGETRLESAPVEEREVLLGMIPWALTRGPRVPTEDDPLGPPTAAIDIERFRKVRIEMQDYLRVRAFGHANVYTRFFVDKDKKLVHVFYFVDAGPKTTIASVTVEGAVKVPKEDIIARSGMAVGDPYHEGLRESVVRDLLDSGSFAAAYVRVDTDTKFIAPGTVPDTGGEVRDEQIDAEGNLVPRNLPDGVNVKIHVVEAPRVSMKLRAGFEIDPGRADTALASGFTFRDVFAPMNHLIVEGRIGYGWLFGTLEEPRGPYGEIMIRSVHARALGRLGDLRMTSRYRSDIYPSAYLHEVVVGPGVRTTLDKGMFFDLDVSFFWSQAIGFGPFTEAERATFSLPRDASTYGPILDAAFTWDARDNPIEATRGGFMSFGARIAPGAPIGTHRAFTPNADLRGFIPMGISFALALRGAASFVFGPDEEGVPLALRLFGGGAYGFRGLGRRLFSPLREVCLSIQGLVACGQEEVGGLSLVESSAELRFLPPLSPIGAGAFVDFGGASPNLNPFELGPSLAAGLGIRLRLWYLPAAVDVAYRIFEHGELQGIDDGPFGVFFRLGEAF
jgi:hypothetical protein